MELSVTAIVILILAIVMLGLGLGFIRGMFSKVSTSFDEQISAEPEPPTSSRAAPLTLSRESIITNAGATLVIKMEVFNPTSMPIPATTIPTIECKGGSADFTPTISVNGKIIAQGETASFNILLPVPATQGTGISLCKVTMNTVGQKDFTIQVQ